MTPMNLEESFKLDREEQEISDAFDRGEFMPISKEENTRYRAMFESFFKKKKNINIRISEQDLLRVKSKALEEGLPYQTYIASIIHKHVKV